MNAPHGNESPHDGQQRFGYCTTDSRDVLYVYDDGPGDTTVRPTPANIPLGWYPRPLLVPPRPGPDAPPSGNGPQPPNSQ